APAERGVFALRARSARTRSEAARGARLPREPGDRPPRADALAAADPRGTRRRDRNGAGPGTACARSALSFRDAVVVGRTGSGRRIDRRRGAGDSASSEQARARGDYRLVHGPDAAG